MTNTEKRRTPRVGYEARLRFRKLDSHELTFLDDEAVSHDLGLGGLGVILPGSIQLVREEMLKVEVVEGKVKGLRAFAEVAWAGEGRAGLRFLPLLESDEERILAVLQGPR